MRSLWAPLAALTAVFSANIVQGATVQYCPSSGGGICYTVGVPSSSASAGSGNIYFQITAPTTYQWVALGTGSGMANSNIFLMYQDGNGNLTLSPRRGTMRTMPTLDTSSTAAKLTLLAGSGVSTDGKTMTANVACANCQSWSGGTMSLASTSAGWIAAWKAGSSLSSTSKSATITQHDDTDRFSIDLTKATISTDSNPFVSTNTGGNSGNGNSTGSDTGSGSGSDSNSGSSGSGSSGSGVTVVSGKPSAAILTAHGLIMALVFVVLYPLGSLLMPLLGNWKVHGSFQIFVWCLMWAGFGLGIVTAKERNMLFTETHTVLGTVVACLLVIQPALGIAHHQYYVRNQKRGLVSYAHIWYGRILMLIGVINGGLGLQLAVAPDNLIIAYGVIAGIIFLVYTATKIFTYMRRKSAHSRGRKDDSSSPTSRERHQYM